MLEAMEPLLREGRGELPVPHDGSARLLEQLLANKDAWPDLLHLSCHGGFSVAEAWRLFSQMGRAEGIAAVGALWGQFLVAGGKIAEARGVLTRSREASLLLEWQAQADEVAALLAGLPAG